MNPITLTTLTPAAAQQNLQSDGLDSLGLATVSLSTRWSNTTPSGGDYNPTSLTLNLTTIRAPFRGIREFAFAAASSTLAADLSDSATSLTVAATQGAFFPTPIGGNVLLTLSNASGSKVEVVSCTARTGDTLTIDRGVQGTAKQAFSTGDRVALRLTSGTRTSQFYGADGIALTVACTVFRLHPQAALRLETLATNRYVTAGNPAILPLPVVMVVRGAQGFSTARWFEPDELLTGISGLVSFHDRRGLILDPIYVAALLADLQTGLPGLVGQNSPSPAGGTGGVQAIAGLATGTLVQILDLHGRIYQPALPGATLVTKDGGGSVTGAVPASGLVTLALGDGIDTAGNDNGQLRWGWLTNGILATTKLVPPLPATGAPTPTLGRQFYQLAVMDTVWALLGNRTAAPVLGIGADDQTIPSDLLPLVRDNLRINYLVDGPDVLAQAATVLTRPAQNMILAISPVVDGTLSIPTQTGAAAHWPAFPLPNSAAGFPMPPADPTTGITAAWTTGNDVVVTIAINQVPDGASIRLYPQQFVVIPAITADLSFVRGDGGAAIAQAGTATPILLPNPFGLAAGQPRPSPANLTIDLVVAPRNGARRLWGGVTVTVAAGPAPAPPNPFAGGNVLAAMPAMFQAIAPSPLFNIPTTVTPPGTAPTGIVGLVRALASETSPRQGPRLPTMARFDTVMVTGTTGGTPTGTLLWEAVLTGGRWAAESRSALHASGNPGNPAGPDVHAPGIHVTGALAYDLARHALRRAQAMIPVGAGALGWVVGMGGDNFNPPTDSNPANTGIGVMLETVAAVCETPELSALTPPAPGNTLQSMLNSAAAALGIPAPSLSVTNEPRLEVEVRREFVVSQAGLRDALWSLRRAVREARELIYIESPQFAHTGSTVDLVAEMITSLAANPNLKVLICTPRESDFAQNYKGWARQHYQARTQAIGDLLTAAPDRVAAFHAPGFPGRSAFLRTTTVIVDDVWCLSGATHWRRRGFTFDGSVAVATCDRQLENGYSQAVRAYRRALMAAKLGVAVPLPGAPTAEWIRLAYPGAAFELVKDWLAEGGLGRIQPLWPGPADTSILPATQDMADPDGSDGATFVTAFASLLAELGD